MTVIPLRRRYTDMINTKGMEHEKRMKYSSTQQKFGTRKSGINFSNCSKMLNCTRRLRSFSSRVHHYESGLGKIISDLEIRVRFGGGPKNSPTLGLKRTDQDSALLIIS